MEVGIKVHEAMTQHPVVVKHDMSLRDCAKVMHEKHVGALLIEKDDKLQGIATEQDIVRKAVMKNLDMEKTRISRIMETNLVKINPREDIGSAIRKMGHMNVRHLPVFENGNFVGLITTKDILRVEPHLFELLAAQIELREESRKPINSINENEGLCEMCGNYTPVLYKREGSMVCHRCR